MSAFDPIVLAGDVQQVVIATLRRWMDTYLRELERRTNREALALPAIKNWALADQTERTLEQQLPGAQVTFSDLDLIGHADTLSGSFDAQIEVLVRSTTFQAVHDLAWLYAFAIGMICQQKLGHDEQVAGNDLLDGVVVHRISVPQVPGANRRERAVGIVDITIQIPDVISVDVQLADPAPDATPVPPDAPTVQTADITADLTES